MSQDQFHPQELVDHGEREAAIGIKDMSSDDLVIFTREFVFALEKAGIISKIDPEDPSASATAALQALTAGALFRRSFIKAYQVAERHLDSVEKLNRQFDL